MLKSTTFRFMKAVFSPIRTVIVSQGDVSDFHHIQGVVDDLITVRIHISEFMRRNRFKIQCLIPFWALPNTVTLYFGVIYILFLKCWKVFKRTILHNCSTTATGSRKRRKAQTSRKRRKARKHSKWVFIMAAAGMQYNFKMCIINGYITYNYIQL